MEGKIGNIHILNTKTIYSQVVQEHISYDIRQILLHIFHNVNKNYYIGKITDFNLSWN